MSRGITGLELLITLVRKHWTVVLNLRIAQSVSRIAVHHIWYKKELRSNPLLNILGDSITISDIKLFLL